MKNGLNILIATLILLILGQSLYATEFQVSGEYRIRGYSYNSVTGIDAGQGDQADYFDQRLLLTGRVTQEMSTGILELNLFNTNNGCSTGSTCTGVSQGGNILGTNGPYTSNIANGGVHQAYINIEFPLGNLMAGRRIIKLGHGLILNDTSDNLTFSIPIQNVSMDIAYLRLFAIDNVQNSINTPNDMDRNGYLVNIGVKPADRWNLGIFYVYDSQSEQSTVGNNTIVVGGVSMDGQAGRLNITLEYDGLGGWASQSDPACVNAGAACSYKGSNLFAAISGDIVIGKVGMEYIRVTGASAGSSDVSVNSLAGDFVGGHGILLNDQTRYGGGIDLNSRIVDANYGPNPVLNNNFHALKLFGETTPRESLNIGVEIYPFFQLVDSAVAAGTPYAVIAKNGDTNIGQEYNIYGGYHLRKNLDLTVVAAYLNTGAVIKDFSAIAGGNGNTTNVSKVNAGLTYKY
jgi:hypothetical protein